MSPTLRKFFSILFPLLYGATSLLSQVYINGICSVNQNSLVSAAGDTPDWIELYNAGNETVNLENYYLSDGETNFQKWQFPAVLLTTN